MELPSRTLHFCLALALSGCALGCDSGVREFPSPGDTSFGEPDTFPTPLRPADSPTPAAPVCAFQAGHRVAFEIVEGIPNPRCARATQDQGLTLTNHTRERISFDLGGGPVTIEPGLTWSIHHPMAAWLSPGVHRIAMDFYAGSGPELWVQDSSVVRIDGSVTEAFVSARAIVVDTPAGSRNVAIDGETRIFGAGGEAAAPERFSLVLSPGKRVLAIVDMESADTGTALEIRVAGDDD
ncbi:MAG TPA: hypothetical protein VFH11_14025 [Gemmatimonadota bacterium]|nr:hypothetical protein [Gemmatimonadota bacterium]